jgi:hypothetical protein
MILSGKNNSDLLGKGTHRMIQEDAELTVELGVLIKQMSI